ncbi:MAG: Fur family transcriptional regulator [Spirochaetales bacterium]|nr:Fur family transcriptional regulator [Spirochaetales bacterium]
MGPGYGNGQGRGRGRGRRWGQQLENHGIRPTAGRELVFSVMRETEAHLSADDVFQEVRKIEPGIGLTTVYRSLELLYQNGLVNKFDFGDGRAVFELSDRYSEKGPHQHLICRSCGKILDLTGFRAEEKSFAEGMKNHVDKEYGFAAEGMAIKIYGLCSDCRKE